MRKLTKILDRTAELESDENTKLTDLSRSDFVFEARNRAKRGEPRFVALGNDAEVFVRIVPQIDHAEHASRRGADDRRDRHSVNRLIRGLTEPMSLLGPSTVHEVDELAAELFDEAPNFAPAIQAIRISAQTIIRSGARWLQFRPIVIQSSPGAGKTRLATMLAKISGLPLIYLDCAAMTNMTPLLGQDSSWGNSRASEILEGLARHATANILVVLDELDKLREFSRSSSMQPSEALVGLLEKRSASAHIDHYTQLPIDLSFINWVILSNDLDRLSGPLLDRCQVIRLPPPSPGEIAIIAARQIERRGLEPELVAPITRAVRRGQITSLRHLHKLLDAASAASARPILN